MATFVTDGKAVAVGDIVTYHQRGKHRSPPPVVCTVVRATRTGLTVKLPDGSMVSRQFAVTYRVRAWGGGTATHHNFHRLDGRERWLLAKPEGLNVVADYHRGFSTVILTADDVRDLRTTTIRLAELADWLEREVAKGTP